MVYVIIFISRVFALTLQMIFESFFLYQQGCVEMHFPESNDSSPKVVPKKKLIRWLDFFQKKKQKERDLAGFEKGKDNDLAHTHKKMSAKPMFSNLKKIRAHRASSQVTRLFLTK